MHESAAPDLDVPWPPLPIYRVLLPERGGTEGKPGVSVIVPTCGRRDLLRRCMHALGALERPPGGVEVIVVDDSEKRSGPAAARNRGWKKAGADVIAFTDDDTEPDPKWLVNGLKPFGDGADAVCGRIIMPINDAPSDYARDAARLEESEFVTANCLIRKSVLEKLGGFDERFKLAWREDSDLHFRLLSAGADLRSAPDAVVVHPLRPAPWGVSLTQQRKVMFDALLFKKHRRLYRERIRATPRWDYYAIVASLLLGIAFPWMLVVWLVLTARFCLHRMRGTSKAPGHVAEVILTSIAIPPLAVFWRIVGAIKFRVGFC